jgi:hypothetical protein
MLDTYAATIEHRKIIMANIEANLRRDRQSKPKRPKPDTPYKGSWAESERLRKERGEPLPKSPAYDNHWVTLGRL